MKTKKQIRLDLNKRKKELKDKGKTMGETAESHYLTAIKTVQNLTIEKIKGQRKKLIDHIDLIDGKYNIYFENFTAFRLKNDLTHELAVRKEFKKVYGLTKLNNRLKWINYVLED